MCRLPHQHLQARRHFTVSLFHSPEQYARQACVHHEAQIAAESAESEIQVEAEDRTSGVKYRIQISRIHLFLAAPAFSSCGLQELRFDFGAQVEQGSRVHRL